jgi:membrane protein implicated in regulation of membrane protease activity
MEWSAIAIFYAACLAFGFLFALLGAIFGELGGHFHFDFGGHHVELGHGGGFSHGVEAGHEVGGGSHEVGGGGVEADQSMPGANVFNTITMSTFLAFFGLAGLITVWVFHLPTVISLLLAFPLSIVIAAGQFLLWLNLFVKAQASSEATMFEILGSEAEVISSIPGDHVGQIAYVIKGSRFTAPAVSSDTEDIPRGAKVQIVNIKGATLVVKPL